MVDDNGMEGVLMIMEVPPPPLSHLQTPFAPSRLFTELKAAEERERALLGYWRQLQVTLV